VHPRSIVARQLMSQAISTFHYMVKPEEVVDRFLYKSNIPSKLHRNRVETYLVERLKGSNIVARIQPLGLVPERVTDQDAALAVLRHNLVVVGGWRATARRHHSRARVAQK